jgi:hypothetical protein
MLQHRFFHRLTHLGPLGPIAGAVHVAALAQGADGAGLTTSASPGLAYDGGITIKHGEKYGKMMQKPCNVSEFVYVCWE